MKKSLTAVLVVLFSFLVLSFAINNKINGSTSEPIENLGESNHSSLEENVSENGIKIKFLSQKVEGETIIKTFNYYISPLNATNKNIEATSKFIDGTSCADIIEVSIDAKAQTIDIKCKEAFDKVINIDLVALSNPKVTAKITLNYVQKILGMTAKERFCNYLGDIIIPEAGAGSDHVNQKINYLDYFTPIYSTKYTKTQNYTFQIENLILILDRDCTGMTDGVHPSNISIISANVDSYITSCLETAFTNESTFSFDPQVIWNVTDLNVFHSNLKELSLNETSKYKDDIGIKYNAFIDFYCVEDPEIKCSYSGAISILFQGTFADDTLFPVLVDSLTLEENSVDF